MGWRPSRRTLIRTAVIGAAGAGVAWVATRPRDLPTGVTFIEGHFTTPRWPGGNPWWGVAIPARPKATVIALHGLGGDGKRWFDAYDAAQVASDTGLAIAAVDGGSTWWHARSSGIDTGALVSLDLIPALSAAGLPTDRLGFTGLSMGGFGALLLGSGLPPASVIAIAAMSSAVWPTWASVPVGSAFDGPDDFAAHDVFGRADALAKVPVWLACGTEDNLLPSNRSLAALLPHATTVFDAGKHEGDYWRGHLPAAAAFIRDHV